MLSASLAASKDYNEANDDQKRLLLTAMGNEKKGIFQGEILKALHSSNEDLRESAAFSLRFKTDPDSRNALSKTALDSDESKSVKLAAVEAIAYQPYDGQTLSTLESILGNPDSHEDIRKKSYAILINKKNDRRTLPVIEKSLMKESNLEIKQYVSDAISRKDDL